MMRYQPMTPERLDAIREAMATMTRKELLRHFQISSNTLTKYDLKKMPADDKRLTKVQPHQVEQVRDLTAQGLSEVQISKETGLSCRQVRRTKEKHGIKAIPMSERPKKPKAPRKANPAKPKGRNPMQSLLQWKPPTSTTSLELAVDKLRAKLKAPVFAEDTRRRPDKPPKPYTPETVFIVGNRRMTGAEILASA